MIRNRGFGKEEDKLVSYERPALSVLNVGEQLPTTHAPELADREQFDGMRGVRASDVVTIPKYVK
jgi:hypothetical protein